MAKGEKIKPGFRICNSEPLDDAVSVTGFAKNTRMNELPNGRSEHKAALSPNFTERSTKNRHQAQGMNAPCLGSSSAGAGTDGGVLASPDGRGSRETGKVWSRMEARRRRGSLARGGGAAGLRIGSRGPRRGRRGRLQAPQAGVWIRGPRLPEALLVTGDPEVFRTRCATSKRVPT